MIVLARTDLTGFQSVEYFRNDEEFVSVISNDMSKIGYSKNAKSVNYWIRALRNESNHMRIFTHSEDLHQAGFEFPAEVSDEDRVVYQQLIAKITGSSQMYNNARDDYGLRVINTKKEINDTYRRHMRNLRKQIKDIKYDLETKIMGINDPETVEYFDFTEKELKDEIREKKFDALIEIEEVKTEMGNIRQEREDALAELEMRKRNG